MADPTQLPAPASPFKTFLLHVFSWHALMIVVGQAAAITGTLPQLAQWHALLVSLGETLTLVGAVKASIFKTPYEKAAVKLAFATTRVTAGTIISGQAVTMLIPFLLVSALALHGCALPQPIPSNLDGGTPVQRYTAAFKNCLENQGISQADPAVANIWSILDTGGSSAQAIEKSIETAGLTLTVDTAVIVMQCALDAWLASNPIAVNGKKTPSQAAVLLYKAKNLKAPTVRK